MRKINRLCALLLLAGAASGQPGPTLQDSGQKVLQMVRTEVPPVIDGVLDDAVWANAAVIDDMHQVRPIEYAEPFEHTEIRLLYDDNGLYIAARLYDSSPEGITAQNTRQNDSIRDDDAILVTLDPFNTRRSGYFFGVNPNGIRQDGLFQNVSEFYSAWDGIYYAQTGRFEGGWLAEFEIPFKTLSFDASAESWGLNFVRLFQRRNETQAWVSRNRSFNPSASGLAVGFEGLNQGIGLEVVPSVSIVDSRNVDVGSSGSDFEPSLDVAYRLTPSLNASVTINTDFSATEVDDRQVNLTRFGLFFPEKRDFFLREADIFEFGRIGSNVDAVYAFDRAGLQNGRPFFSRRIGLSKSGQIVDIDYGAKISGRVGNWEIGALSIRQDEFADVTAETLSVLRAKLNVLQESTIGVIATDGNPGENLDNSVAGFDFIYRNTRLPGGRTLEAEVWLQRSDTEGFDANESAAGIGIRLPSNSGIRAGLTAKEVEANFNPALGFVSRQGVRDYAFDLGYTYRPTTGPIQSVQAILDGQKIERIDGGMQSQQINLRPVILTNRQGDFIDTLYREQKEVLIAPFEISPGIVIPVGEYDSYTAGAQAITSSHRSFAGQLRYGDGTAWDGRQMSLLGALTWRPSAKFRSSISYDYREFRLPQGDFEIRLVTIGIDYAFSSTMSWVNLIQYDNASETAGINMRWHWIPEAGRELFFVINHNLQDLDRDNTFNSTSSDMTAKFTYTLRF